MPRTTAPEQPGCCCAPQDGARGHDRVRWSPCGESVWAGREEVRIDTETVRASCARHPWRRRALSPRPGWAARPLPISPLAPYALVRRVARSGTSLARAATSARRRGRRTSGRRTMGWAMTRRPRRRHRGGAPWRCDRCAHRDRPHAERVGGPAADEPYGHHRVPTGRSARCTPAATPQRVCLRR